MRTKLNTFALVGMDGVPVEVEVDVASGLPKKDDRRDEHREVNFYDVA